MLRCSDPALPPLKAICTVSHFPAESAYAHYSHSIYHAVAPKVLHSFTLKFVLMHALYPIASNFLLSCNVFVANKFYNYAL